MDRGLSAPTVRYLFASDWAAPPGAAGWNVRVPDGKASGPETAANLLNLAVWSLREQGLVDVQPIRPVEAERVVVLGGQSFVRLVPLSSAPDLGGLEGALMRQAEERSGAGGGIATRIARDDPLGLRGLILGLGLSSGSPWTSVVGVCRDEARDAGVVEIQGRLTRKPVIAPGAPLDELRSRDAEIVAARQEFKTREPDLDESVFADCAAAIDWAHTS